MMVETTTEIELRKALDVLENLKSKIFLVEFAGKIGSGKSETAKELQKLIETKVKDGRDYVQFDFMYEEVGAPVEDFYKGQSSPAVIEETICGNRMRKLSEAVCNMDKRLKGNGIGVIISDRSIPEDIPFIDKLELELPENSDEEKSSLRRVKENVKNLDLAMFDMSPQKFDRIIFELTTPADECVSRIKKRGRSFEGELAEEDLCRLSYDFRGRRDVIRTNNVGISARHLAAVLFIKIARLLGEQKVELVPNISVSVYGIPGSGKTRLVEHLRKIIGEGFGTSFLLDDSEDPFIVKEQKERYENNGGMMSGDQIQEELDKRRIERYKKLTDLHGKHLFVTDIGPLTSEVFRAVTGAKENVRYSNELNSDFNYRLDFLLVPRCKEVVLKKIKERGRDGETSGLTMRYLTEIEAELFKRLEETGVRLTNNYTERDLELNSSIVMETVRYAITWYRGK